jgi:hypothetical protein
VGHEDGKPSFATTNGPELRVEQSATSGCRRLQAVKPLSSEGRRRRAAVGAVRQDRRYRGDVVARCERADGVSHINGSSLLTMGGTPSSRSEAYSAHDGKARLSDNEFVLPILTVPPLRARGVDYHKFRDFFCDRGYGTRVSDLRNRGLHLVQSVTRGRLTRAGGV